MYCLLQLSNYAVTSVKCISNCGIFILNGMHLLKRGFYKYTLMLKKLPVLFFSWTIYVCILLEYLSINRFERKESDVHQSEKIITY